MNTHAPTLPRSGAAFHDIRTVRRLTLTCLLVTSLAFTFTAQARTLYVSRCASPGGDGSSSRPFQTILQAHQTAAAGDVISVEAGPYSETFTLTKAILIIQPQGGAVVVGVPAPPCPNNPPSVNAGGDQRLVVPPAASYRACLSGTASDDGRPSGQLTVTWGKDSGPGTVAFDDARALNTCATFSAAGAYALRLTASDGALSSSDTMTVTVVLNSANEPPSVSAGPDFNAIGERSSANNPPFLARYTLDGQAADDGLPNPPARLTTQWTLVSGPSAVTFNSQTSPQTDVYFHQTGLYVLRLTATDGNESRFDDVMATVVERPANSYLSFYTDYSSTCDASGAYSLRLRNNHPCATISFVAGVTRRCPAQNTNPESIVRGALTPGTSTNITCMDSFRDIWVCYYQSHRLISASYASGCGLLAAQGIGEEPPLLEINRATNGAPQASLIGRAGRTYTVEVSTNLLSWETLTNVVVGEFVVPIVDPQATQNPCRFYRVRSD